MLYRLILSWSSSTGANAIEIDVFEVTGISQHLLTLTALLLIILEVIIINDREIVIIKVNINHDDIIWWSLVGRSVGLSVGLSVGRSVSRSLSRSYSNNNYKLLIVGAKT